MGKENYKRKTEIKETCPSSPTCCKPKLVGCPSTASYPAGTFLSCLVLLFNPVFIRLTRCHSSRQEIIGIRLLSNNLFFIKGMAVGPCENQLQHVILYIKENYPSKKQVCYSLLCSHEVSNTVKFLY